MKTLVAYIVLVGYLSLSVYNLIPYAGYYANKNYIAAELCINKANKALDCKGKCYLAKQVTAAEKAHKKSENTNQTRYEVLTVLNYNIQISTCNILASSLSLFNICPISRALPPYIGPPPNFIS